MRFTWFLRLQDWHLIFSLTVCPVPALMEKLPAVYILANSPHGTLYVGVTSNLPTRIYQHKNGYSKGFAAKYNVDRLVYYEVAGDMYAAISREKQIKAGSRKRKIMLIERMNPKWHDLYERILD